MMIQNIKNQNLICLDFDDCIIEWSRFENNQFKPNKKSTIIKNLKKNVITIKQFCHRNNYKVFITSSWVKFIVEDNGNFFIPKRSELGRFHRNLFNIIKTLPIIGKDIFDDRILAIEVLLENNNRVICIDDLDLAHYFNSDNFIMLNILNGAGLKEKLLKVEKKLLKELKC